MAAKAYVLINVKADQTGAALQALRNIPGIRLAEAITGPYDLIATIHAADANVVGKIVLNEIRGVPAVQSTLTCLVIEDIGT